MQHKRRLLLILIMLAALLLAACDGGDGDDDPTATPTEEVVEEPTVAEVEEEPSVEPTEEDVEEPTEEAVVEEPTEEIAVEEPTEEAVVEEPTEEMAVEEPTEEATEEAVEEPLEATEEADAPGVIVEEIVTEAGDFTILLQALESADLVETLSGEGPFTVFAPTDEAFEAALESLGLTAEDLLADTETLTNILLYHVVEGEVMAEDVMGMESAETLLDGAEITIESSDDGVVLNDSVNVIMTDLDASNGVIHVIDGVLVPESVLEVAMVTEPTEAPTVEETEEAVVEEPTEEPTVEATEEAVVEEPTEEPMDEEPTEEPMAEATEEAVSGSLISSVCLVTDQGGVNDGTFNQLANDGMLRAAADFGLETTTIESNTPSDFEPNITTCLDTGHDVVVTVGFLLGDATRAAAEANPDVYFIGVDQFFEDHTDNLVGIQSREDQGGFLVGVMAALMTESDVVGGVYGIDVPAVVKFRHGFEQGVRYINPDIEVLGVYIDSFVDPAAGASAAEQMLGQGADVIFGAGGSTGTGGIQFAAAEDVYVIGVDQDEYFTSFGGGETPGAEYLISSALKAVDVGVYDMLQALVTGEIEWMGGGLYLLEAANDGVAFAPPHDADVPEEVTEQVEEVYELLKSGELTTGVDAVTGALLDASGEPMEEEEPTEEPEATEESE